MNYKKILSLIVAVTLLFSTCGSKVYAAENVYVVQAGDSLWGIAEKFLGDGTRHTDIVSWNEELIQDASLIYPGTQLRIMADTDMEAGIKADAGEMTDIVNNAGEEASEQTSGEITAGSYQQGTISGTTWRSEWLGMQLELPEGFEFRNGDEYFGEINASDEENELSDALYGCSIVEFYAVNPSALYSGAFLGVEQTDYSIEEYIEKTQSNVNGLLGIAYDALYSADYKEGRKEAEKIGGRSFEHYFCKEEFKEEYMYFAICLDYYITKIDDKIVILFTAYIDMDSETIALLGDYYADHGIDELLDGFSAYNSFRERTCKYRSESV